MGTETPSREQQIQEVKTYFAWFIKDMSSKFHDMGDFIFTDVSPLILRLKPFVGVVDSLNSASLNRLTMIIGLLNQIRNMSASRFEAIPRTYEGQIKGILAQISGYISEMQSISQPDAPVFPQARPDVLPQETARPKEGGNWLSAHASTFDQEPQVEDKFRARFEAISQELKKQADMAHLFDAHQINILHYVGSTIYDPLEKLFDSPPADKETQKTMLGMLVFLETLYGIEKVVLRGGEGRTSFATDFLEKIKERQNALSEELKHRAETVESKVEEEGVNYERYLAGRSHLQYDEERRQMMRFITKQFANLDLAQPEAVIVVSLLEQVLKIERPVLRHNMGRGALRGG